jgi:hypothetical protein
LTLRFSSGDYLLQQILTGFHKFCAVAIVLKDITMREEHSRFKNDRVPTRQFL